MAGVFISYRRSDSDVAAGRLADDLSEIFGRDAIFRDVDTLEAGEDYTKALDHALDSCVALIAMIGPRWSNVTDDEGHRRLDDPRDWVRMEISRALDRGVRVIPILVSAAMPRETDVSAGLQPLLQRHAIELTDRHWRQDIDLLAQALEKVPGFAKRVSVTNRANPIVTRRHALAASGGFIVLTIFTWLGLRHWESPVAVAPVDLSQWVRIRNSGTEGSVAGLAVVTAMEASLAQQRRPVTLSARYLYEKTKSVDRYEPNSEGTDMTAALYVAETFGAPPEARWPYIAGSRDLPNGATWKSMDKAAAKFRARTFRLSGYEDILQQLTQGRLVLAQIRLTDAWMSDEAATTGFIKLGDKENWIGLYAVVIVGFDPVDSTIKFANSWGVNWGANGFGRMAAKDAQRALTAMWAIDVPSREP